MNCRLKIFKKGFDANLVVEKIKNELQIKGNVKVIFDSSKEIPESFMQSIGGVETIIIGFKNYNLEELDEHQKRRISNTIYHELVHVRNRRQARSTISDSVMNSRTLAHLGYSLLDELSAYSEANNIYPEKKDDLNIDYEELYDGLFEGLTVGVRCIEGRLERTEQDQNKFFRACLDNCISLIPIYVISGGVPEDKKYYPFKRTIKGLSSHEANFEKLTLDDYEKIGKEYIENLIYDLSSSKRKIFWINTGIDL
jgi:hypothetical protein